MQQSDLSWDPLLRVVFKINKDDQINSNSNYNCFAYKSSQDRDLFWEEFQAKSREKKIKIDPRGGRPMHALSPLGDNHHRVRLA